MLLVGIALNTIVALLVALISAMTEAVPPQALSHIIFAWVIMPLIVAAMIHFVPVLTRTEAASKWIARLPWLLVMAGVLLVLTLAGIFPRQTVHGVALIVMIAAALTIYWIFRRIRKAIGRPHPCVYWYLSSLGALLLAVSSAPFLYTFPQYWTALRNVHIHLNIVGFILFAVLGTLPVLLPTALSLPDQTAYHRLKVLYFPMIIGLVSLIVGFIIWLPLTYVGGGLISIVVVANLRAWRQQYRWQHLLHDGVASSLFLATLFLLVLLIAGLAHGARPHDLPARPAILAGFVGFLLPLITGALSQLIPVWAFPGAAIAKRKEWRNALARTGLFRAPLFLIAGMTLLLSGNTFYAVLIAFFGCLLFIGELIWLFLNPHRT